MLLQLPAFNALLVPCPASAAAFTAHEHGQFCDNCQRVVQDFSQSQNPLVDLVTARAAAPDGRVCGSFRREQVVVSPAPTLSRRLKWFLVALVLVVGQGMRAQEALAQVRRPVPEHLRSAAMPVKSEAEAATAPLPDEHPTIVFGMVVEQMPQLPGEGGLQAVVQYIQKRVVWPRQNGKIVTAQGRLFASFTVGADGRVHEAKIVKTFNPLFNESVLSVIRALPEFKPGMQNNRPVSTTMMVPINFTLR